MKKPTMQDVANAAGVSKMAVSYALRYHPRISSETAKRIRSVATDMGYTPNPLVAALCSEVRARNHSKNPPVIAFLSLLPLSNSLVASTSAQGAYYKGAKARCEDLGFQLELFEPFISDLSGKHLAKILKYRNINAIITTGSNSYDFAWDDFFGISIGPPPRPPLQQSHLLPLQVHARHPFAAEIHGVPEDCDRAEWPMGGNRILT